ncbi:phosphotransferase [Actinocorallia populi]|uniref:phosphotransferase n=1 Tax=Actinocorallia populi TaxID=2079200 RepID=UPI001300BA28|nr:phosphotransferase [Actinocorallia populi]
MSAAALPDASGLTADWLTEALAPRLAGVKVTGVEAAPVGTGQVSDTFRLTLAYDRPADLPATLIAKVPALDPASRAAARAIRTYEIEAGFYTHLATGLAAAVPVCHFSAHEAENDDYTVLLEDLAPARPGDQLAGITVEEAAAAADELALLHAAGWDSPDLAALPWLNRHDTASAEFTAAMITGLYEGFRERYADRLSAEVLTLLEDFVPRLGAYLTPGSGPSTLVHGDFRADNLLFGRPRPVILDWQTCAYGSPLSDLAYLLGSSLPVETRRAHERTLVRRYHAALTSSGVPLGWDDCWTSYREHVFHGIAMAVGASMLVERTDRGDEMFCTMTTRHAHHALDLDSLSLLG